VGEEGNEEEVQLARVRQVIDAGIAEADGLALGIGEDGDIDVAGEGDADTGSDDGGAEPGAGVEADDDTVVVEGDVGLFGVDVTGGVSVATKIIASIRAVKELRLEGAFERLGRDADLRCMGRGSHKEDSVEKQRTSHETKDNGWRRVG
jgi:hypothetical protein